MKLIELLARELDEWANTTLCYVQDANGDVWPCKSEPELVGDSWEGDHEGSFIDQHDDARHLAEFEKCEDWSTAIVTRDQWETAMYSPTPTLETMLAEWRDLTARAQAAQAEADALFEHAGQCHGEIVVRLAELGWGAPTSQQFGALVKSVSEPVVTLDRPPLADDWYSHVKVGDMLTYRAGDGACHMAKHFTDGESYRVHSVDPAEDTIYAFEVWSDDPGNYYWGNRNYFTPSTQP